MEHWKANLAELESFDNILVDTPGVNLTSQEEFSFFRNLTGQTGRLNSKTHLVLSCAYSAAELLHFSKLFTISTYSDLIFTHVDRTSQHGVLLNFLDKVSKPLHSFGNSVECIEGFEWATKERVLDLIYKLTLKHGAKSNEPQL